VDEKLFKEAVKEAGIDVALNLPAEVVSKYLVRQLESLAKFIEEKDEHLFSQRFKNRWEELG
jgi:hypothetical protein